MSEPVTVSLTRQVEPGHEDEMLAWMSAGFALAERFPGFLGHGWVRAGVDSTEWHMLVRFADAAALENWNVSSQRRWWLDSAQAFVELQKSEKRTGIEGWFDAPSEVDVQDLRPGVPAPPRWKQMVAIFIAFLPLSIGANYAARALVPDWPLVLRLLAASCVMIPLMTYVVMPWLTRLLAPWLNRR